MDSFYYANKASIYSLNRKKSQFALFKKNLTGVSGVTNFYRNQKNMPSFKVIL